MIKNWIQDPIVSNGKSYRLMYPPLYDNYGTDGGVRFSAVAVDAENKHYRISWDPYPNFDTSDWDGGSDFEDVCDWDNPDDIVLQDY